MSERLEKAQSFIDRICNPHDYEDPIAMLMCAVDQLISEIRELRIEVSK